jgi:hypothetical protein
MRKSAKTFIILGIIGLVLGSITGKLINIPFLNKAIGIGFENPFVLNLDVIKMSFSIMINISIASIIGMVLALLIASRI